MMHVCLGMAGFETLSLSWTFVFSPSLPLITSPAYKLEFPEERLLFQWKGPIPLNSLAGKIDFS